MPPELRSAGARNYDIARMAAAYEAALDLLRHLNSPVKDVVAREIIEIFRSGEHDPPPICASAIKELAVRCLNDAT